MRKELDDDTEKDENGLGDEKVWLRTLLSNLRKRNLENLKNI